MRLNTPDVSIQSIEFLLRRPWHFLFPFVIIISTVFAYTSCTAIKYRSSAILSFKSAGEAALQERRGLYSQAAQVAQKKEDLIARTLYGENIENIANMVWPDITSRADPLKYSGLIDKLRNPKSGIQIKYDPMKGLLNIFYVSSNPTTCYKVVSATIDILKQENKKTKAEEIGAGITFLEKQVEFYKNKLNNIDTEIAELKSELMKKLPEMTEQERALIKQVAGEVSAEIAAGKEAQKAIKYDEILAGLKLDLLEAEKKKEILQRRIGADKSSSEAAFLPNYENDAYINEYVRAIIDKELAITKLTSSGYKGTHPEVAKLQNEIDTLKELRENRIRALMTGATSRVPDKTGGAGSVYDDLDFKIDTLKDKIAMIEGYQKASEDRLKGPGFGTGHISSRIAKLTELKTERDVNMRYYADIRKQLEETELKNRIEKADVGLTIDVVEEPKVPIKPIPLQKIPETIMGLMFALGVGGALAYITDALDQSVRSSAQLRELLQTPVLASIDKMYTAQEIGAVRAQKIIMSASLLIFVLLSRPLVILFLKIAGTK